MSDRTTSVDSVNTPSPADTGPSKPSTIGTATVQEFGTVMHGVSWWATSTQQEQLAVWELYQECGETGADFVAMARDAVSAAEFLGDGEEPDEEQDGEEQE